MRTILVKTSTCLSLLLILIVQIVSYADNDESPPPQNQPPPYTMPWQLRSVVPSNVFRLDSAQAFYNDSAGNTGGFANATVLTGSYKITSDAAVLARVGMVATSPPAGATGAFSITNPLIGGVYSLTFPDNFKLGLFLAMALPVGMGSGNTPVAAVSSANKTGILARSAMDNALFAVNYLTIIPGAGLAYLSQGWTFQIEATLLQLIRVQGELVDLDASRTNLTSGLFVGYSVSPSFSLSTELRYQRWISNATVAAAASPPVENMSFAAGARFTFKWNNLTFKPGIAYAFGLMGPIATAGFTYPSNSDKVIFIDFPIFF